MFADLMRKRRSIRQFRQRPVEKEKRDIIIETMLRSPSSRSLNPWHFVVVTEAKTIEALAQSKPHGATFMKNAPLAIAVCADPEKCDVWVEDCSIAAYTIHLAAADLDLGSCWVQIRMRDHSVDRSAEEYVKDLLGLAGTMRVEALVAIGYAREEKSGHGLASLPFDQVSFEKYGNMES
jgi:nitroreductase